MKKRRKILVFNVGSSSIKYSLFEEKTLIKSGGYERLKTREDYSKAVENIFKKINPKNVDLIAHRIVHAGDLKKPSKINSKVERQIKKFSEFAPLHNPEQLIVVKLCKRYKKPQYALFDTMFFSSLPEVAKTYAIQRQISKKYKVEKYGFHGLSHMNASKNLRGKTIVCHLGSGSSISAVVNGKPIDTSMGFTPLDGIMMSTRSGSIDPGIIFFLEEKGYNTKEMLTEKSGFKGICGYSEFKDILSKKSKDKNCKLAYEMFVYQVIKTIGSYISAMNGLDNLVFTGKIGENSSELRKDVCKSLSFLKSKPKILVIKTNEEKVMIEELMKIL